MEHLEGGAGHQLRDGWSGRIDLQGWSGGPSTQVTVSRAAIQGTLPSTERPPRGSLAFRARRTGTDLLMAHLLSSQVGGGSATRSGELARAMAEAALLLNEPSEDMDTVLSRLIEAALQTVPDVDLVSISVASRDAVSTKAATDPLARTVDQLQYDLQEGPCIDALLDPAESEVVVDDLTADQRWPRYAPAAASHGLRSQMGIAIYREGHSVGGLNLYAARPHAFDDETRAAAEIFAVHAAVALDKARTVTSLTAALESRQIIGQAVGIVMHTYTVSESAAFHYLTRVSQTTNIKLRDVAARMVAIANDEGTDAAR
ncbi:hypothetical protein GCM10009616_00650 [Microlunatus lacustris]